MMKDVADMIIPTYQDMLDAHERIKPHIRRTDIRTSDYLNELAGCEPVSYTHLTLPTTCTPCRSRWSPYH
mgnify:CR=1 FL=1